MLNNIIVMFLLLTSVAYAEISSVTIDDVKDHVKIVDKLNQIITQINSTTKSIQAEQVVVKATVDSMVARVTKLEPAIAAPVHIKADPE